MFVTSKLPQHLGQSGWVSMLPKRTPRPALSGTVNADIAVIGAGFAGLATARSLSQIDPKLKVVIWRRARLRRARRGAIRVSSSICSTRCRRRITAARTTMRAVTTSRCIAPRSRSSPSSRSKRAGAARSSTVREVQRGAWSAGRRPCCVVCETARQGEGTVSSEPYRLLDAQEIAAVTGTRSFTSAIYTPDTVIIQLAAFVRGLADSSDGNVQLFEHSPAMSFERQGSSWRIKTQNGVVNAGRIILANDGQAQNFGLFRDQLLHDTYVSMTRAFDPTLLGGHRSWAATPAFPMGMTVRRVEGSDGNRILIRSRYTYNRYSIGGP